MPVFTLTQLSGHYAVCHLPPTATLPPWAIPVGATSGDFFTITRTHDELSIICAETVLPSAIPDATTIARDWVLLRVEGPFTFDVTGVLAALSQPLAAAGVVLLAIATYQTDYLLVKAAQLDAARHALRAAGHTVIAD